MAEGPWLWHRLKTTITVVITTTLLMLEATRLRKTDLHWRHALRIAAKNMDHSRQSRIKAVSSPVTAFKWVNWLKMAFIGTRQAKIWLRLFRHPALLKEIEASRSLAIRSLCLSIIRHKCNEGKLQKGMLILTRSSQTQSGRVYPQRLQVALSVTLKQTSMANKQWSQWWAPLIRTPDYLQLSIWTRI